MLARAFFMQFWLTRSCQLLRPVPTHDAALAYILTHWLSRTRPLVSATFVSFHAGWGRHPGAAHRTIDALVSDLEAISSAAAPADSTGAEPSTAASPSPGGTADADTPGAPEMAATDQDAAAGGAAGSAAVNREMDRAAHLKRLLALLSCVAAVAKGCGVSIAPHTAGMQLLPLCGNCGLCASERTLSACLFNKCSLFWDGSQQVGDGVTARILS